MELIGIKYLQGKQEYISTIMPMELILDNYEVLVYMRDPYGYQRAPKKLHYSKIAKEIKENRHSQVTPSSIIIGVSSNEIENIFIIEKLFDCNGNEVIKLKVKEENQIKFRIIDGQHRVKGFEKAIEDSRKSGDTELAHELRDYNANVIIMISDPKRRKPEVEVFSNINSKAKPLKMDLTILAEHAYDLIEQSNDINVIKYLAVKVVEKLNSGENCEYWKNGIIMDAQNNTVRVGCVGFKTFYESILPICKNVCDSHCELNETTDYNVKKAILEKLSNVIAKDIGECWNYVFEKWNVGKLERIFDGEEFIETYYNTDFYLQRTMGALAINQLIVASYKENSNYKKFYDNIKMSNLTKDDWSIGGKFSGLSSLSGVSKIKSAISNED